MAPSNRHVIFYSARMGQAELSAATVPDHTVADLTEGTKHPPSGSPHPARLSQDGDVAPVSVQVEDAAAI
jgi:hypothetical protein